MGLFDAISPNTAPIRRAGALTSQGYNQARGDITGGTSAALGDLRSAQQQAQDALRQGTGQAQSYIAGATPTEISYLQQGLTGGLNALDPAMQAYQGLFGSGQQGVDLYSRLLGLGPQGSAGIQETLSGLPGYQFELSQGLQAAERPAAAGGRYNPTDLATLASGLAGKDYFNYLAGIQPLMGLATTGAAGLAGVGGQEADLWSGFGQGAAGATQSAAEQQAQLAAGLGSNLSNLYTGIGGARADLQSQQGSQLAGVDVAKAKAKADTLAQLFNANQAGSQNFLGLIGGLVNPLAYLGGQGIQKWG